MEWAAQLCVSPALFSLLRGSCFEDMVSTGQAQFPDKIPGGCVRRLDARRRETPISFVAAVTSPGHLRLRCRLLVLRKPGPMEWRSLSSSFQDWFFRRRRGLHLGNRGLPCDLRKSHRLADWIGARHRRASTGAITRAKPVFLEAVVEHQRSVAGGATATLSRLRMTLVAVVALACIVVLRDWGRPPLTSSYGRACWLRAVLTLLLSQLPTAVALIRTWKAPDRAGLALAIATGATQVLVTFFADLRYTALRLDPWPWLNASLGLAAVVFASWAWRLFFSRKRDIVLLISIFFGFVVYTALAQIALAILRTG